MTEHLRKLLEESGRYASDARLQDFATRTIVRLWDEYNNEIMNRRIETENQVRNLGLRLVNGTVGRPYRCTLTIPEGIVSGLELRLPEDCGLHATVENDSMVTVEGTPVRPGDFDTCLLFKTPGWMDGDPLSELRIPVAFNPDPRSLWIDKPTPEETPFFKPDLDSLYIAVESMPDGTPRKDMVAASRRGRSHAQVGSPRDDDFRLFHCPDTDWYIMAVADGAGSARYSREGSKIACDTVVEYCRSSLLTDTHLEEAVRAYHVSPDDASIRKDLFHQIYGIVGNAAYHAHKAINVFSSATEGSAPKDFATTLMFAVCRRFEFGWFIASYWVGDGAICLYDRDRGIAKLLGVPDEGEYSGQTRFLTMPSIFRTPQDVADRLRFGIYPDFTALFMMTDGVSDPMFETEVNLTDPRQWDRLWEKLRDGFPGDNIPGVKLGNNRPETAVELLNWLDFWSAGNHDDRTIAMLF